MNTEHYFYNPPSLKYKPKMTKKLTKNHKKMSFNPKSKPLSNFFPSGSSLVKVKISSNRKSPILHQMTSKIHLQSSNHNIQYHCQDQDMHSSSTYH